MPVRFKQRCAICKQNMVEMYSSNQFPICTSCHMKRIQQEIPDPIFKELFNIPQSLYEQSHFLRSIKESYLRFNNLTEKQIAAFKKTIEDLKNPKPKEESKEQKTELEITDNISLRAKRLAKKEAAAKKKVQKTEMKPKE